MIPLPFNSLLLNLDNDKRVESDAKASIGFPVKVKFISNQRASLHHVSENRLDSRTERWSRCQRMRWAESRTEGRAPFDIVIIYSLSQHHNPQRSGVSSTPLKCISASVSSSAQNDWVTFMRLMRGRHGCLDEAKSNVEQDNIFTCILLAVQLNMTHATFHHLH